MTRVMRSKHSSSMSRLNPVYTVAIAVIGLSTLGLAIGYYQKSGAFQLPDQASSVAKGKVDYETGRILVSTKAVDKLPAVAQAPSYQEGGPGRASQDQLHPLQCRSYWPDHPGSGGGGPGGAPKKRPSGRGRARRLTSHGCHS